jgi:hypothetical protein
MNDKKLSTILDFEIKKEKESNDLGISEKIAHKKQTKEVPYVVCPFCGMNRVLHKNGRYFINRIKSRVEDIIDIEKRLEQGLEIKSPRSKKYNPNKETRFDIYDLENSPFISLRVNSRGRYSGMEEVRIIRLSDIRKVIPIEDRKEYLELILQLRNSCEEFLSYTNKIIA